MPSPLNQCPTWLRGLGPLRRYQPVELGGDRAFDRQVELGQLVGDGRVVSELEELAGAE